MTDQIPLLRPQPHGAPEDQHSSLGEPIMSLTLSHDGAVSVISVAGEIDLSNAHLLTELVEFLCRAPTPLIAVDLSALRFIGAHGIGALLTSGRLAAEAGGRLTLRALSPFASRVLGVAGVLRHLERDDVPTPTGPPGSDVAPQRPRRAAQTPQPLGRSVAARP
ncbi:STAS domain-containing protein [Micromonospora sp. NPDC005171]|uniref:STAS domain-containing protein n=1 Tax=Micromonospora sp. NPDC005171 TaxID=3156866 RepID=UPI0033A35479